MKTATVENITTEYIKLSDALKFFGLVKSGGDAKVLIQGGKVSVDGEVCTMRGKKLRGGEIISLVE
ncbi:MAG: RNA-binding S4 domain-containing protein [Oscillospiraceae bacterium]|jgi:ribosome-associated protein|nr:RNA-binding S4 domain-containing protein [Oscillospiraceae bacterium]